MFAQVLQILLSATILSTVAEQASNIEFNNERKSGINNLNANDSPDEDNNQIVRRSLLNEKVTQNEDIYYRTFYGYSSETTTKPNNQHDIDTESVDYKGRQELTTIPSYQDNSFVDERDLTVEESIGFGNRKSKKYEKNPTNQDLYTNSNDKRFTYSKQPKPSSYDKVNDYDDAFLEIQNLGSFGSKLHLKANEPKRNNQKTPSPINDVITFNLKKRKKPSRLIPNTNEIITGLDVLNINEAITSDEDNSEKNTKLGTNNDNVIQNATENIESYIQTDDHNKDVYHTAAQSITDNRVSQVKYNGDFFQKPLVEDNLATDTTISEAVTPEYRVTKISQHKVTNLSKNPIVVPDIEATIGKRVTPTQYYFKTTSYTLKPFALAEALKGNFTDKLSGFKDTKSRVVVDIQKSVPIYLGSITKYLRNNFNNNNNNTLDKISVYPQQKNRNSVEPNLQNNLFPVEPIADDKVNYTETRLPPPSYVPYQFEVITPSPTPPTGNIQSESNVTEEYVLLPLDDAANSQIAPLDSSSESKEVQPNLYFVPQLAQNNTLTDYNKDTRYYEDKTNDNYNRNPDDYPQYFTYTLPLPTEPPRLLNVPLNKQVLLPEVHRPAGNNNLFPYMTPYSVPQPINQHHYLDSFLTFQQPPPVNIPPAIRHSYFPALPSNAKPEEPKVLPALPLEFFQIHFPNFNQNKDFKRGRYDYPKINVPNFRKNRAKQVVNHRYPVHPPATTQSPPAFTKTVHQPNNNYQNNPSNNINNNNNLKLQRPADLESSNSAKIEHYGHNFRSNRNARHNFDNVKMEYGFMPPLIPSMQIDEYGRPIEDTKS